ncbi:MAG: hypothetical protein ACRD9S_24850 [Pyrinomonadaceae bacterium]
MKRVRNFFIGLAVILGGAYACASIVHPTVILRYRLTLEAMTPDGPKTGSGVIQVSYGSQFNLNGGGRKGDMEVTGEAVPLDLGQGKVLFATLTKDGSGRNSTPGRLDGALNAEWLPVVIFGFKWNWGEESRLPAQIKAAKAAGPKDVPFRSLPTLVRFEDVSDPKSVRLVEPERLNAAFGEGFALTKATLEITNDPPTDGIGKVLGWLERIKDYQTDSGNPFTNVLPVSRWQFIQGD